MRWASLEWRNDPPRRSRTFVSNRMWLMLFHCKIIKSTFKLLFNFLVQRSLKSELTCCHLDSRIRRLFFVSDLKWFPFCYTIALRTLWIWGNHFWMYLRRMMPADVFELNILPVCCKNIETNAYQTTPGIKNNFKILQRFTAEWVVRNDVSNTFTFSFKFECSISIIKMIC